MCTNATALGYTSLAAAANSTIRWHYFINRFGSTAVVQMQRFLGLIQSFWVMKPILPHLAIGSESFSTETSETFG